MSSRSRRSACPGRADKPIARNTSRVATLATAVAIALLSGPASARRQPASLVTPGSTEANISVSPSGSLVYSIPILAPPGSGGLSPKLGLSYAHGGGADPVGLGWAVTGTNAIQRGAKNLDDDGEVRGISLDASDALYLDGERLILVADVAAQGFREFRQRIDNYARVRAYDWNANGPQRFVVETRAGLTLSFGSTAASRVTLGGAVLKWLCDRIEDSTGNYMEFRYDIEGLLSRIASVEYGGNTRTGQSGYAGIQFHYEQVNPYDLRYLLGERVEQRHVLRKVESRFQQAVLRVYSLRHEQADAVRPVHRLVDVTEAGADGLSFRPLAFLYSNASGGWIKQERLKLPVEVSELAGVPAGFEVRDFQGDGRPDLLLRARIGGQEKRAAFVNRPAIGWVALDANAWAPPVDLADESGRNPAVRFADVSGDGKSEIVWSDLSSAGVAVAGANGWEVKATSVPYAFVRNGMVDGTSTFIDVDPANANGQELVWGSAVHGRGAARFSGNGWTLLPSLRPPAFPSAGDGFVQNLDVNHDGRDDLLYVRFGQAQPTAREATSGRWREITDAKWRVPLPGLPDARAVRFVDLDGDGDRDVIFAFEEGGQRRQGAYLATSTGWREDTRDLPADFILWTDTPGASTAELTDINGDRRADMLWNGGSAQQRAAYIGTALAWEVAPGFAPPVAFPEDAEQRRNLIRLIDITGDGAAELLYLAGAPQVFTPHPSNGWQPLQDYQISPTVAQFDRVDLGVRFLDLNGDGYSDVALSRRKLDGTIEKKAYIFDPRAADPWKDDERFHFPVVTFAEDLKDQGIAMADVTGDALTDVIVAVADANGRPLRYETYENCHRLPTCKNATGASAFWRLKPAMATPDALMQESIGPAGARLIDINGDGLTDFVVSRLDFDRLLGQATTYQKTYLNRGDSWSPALSTTIPVDFVRSYLSTEEEPPNSKRRDNRVELLDLNGDRLPDLLYSFRGVEVNTEHGFPQLIVKDKSGAYLNSGTGWDIPAPGHVPPHRIDADDTRPYRQALFEDLNGDGLVDLVYAEKGNSGSASYLNTGRGWVPAPSYNLPADVINESKEDQGFRLLDVNGDRLVDLVYRWKAGGAETSGARLNTGLGWSANQPEYAPPVAFTEEGRGDLGIRPFDPNGDGLPDLAQSYTRSDSESERAVYLNQRTKPDLMTTATNGLGLVSEIRYESFIGLDSAVPAGPAHCVCGEIGPTHYPVIEMPMAGHVVAALRTHGRGVLPKSARYRYGNYKMNVRRGESLGFGYQEVVNETKRRTTQIRYLQTDGLVGSSESVTTLQWSDGVDVRIALSTSRWLPTPGSGMRLGNGVVPTIYRPLLERSVSESWDLASIQLGRTVTSYKYDDFGNPLSVNTINADGSTSVVTNTYANDPARWHLARLLESTSELSAPGVAGQTRRAAFQYDANTGQLAKEVELLGTPKQLTTVYNRDSFGNILEKRITALDGTYRSERRKFDALGRFPISIRNALDHESSTAYDPISGVVLANTDPNGITVRYEYNSLQQRNAELLPTGAASRITRQYLDNADASLAVTTTTDGLPPETEWLDSLGRQRRSERTGSNGKPVVVEQRHDAEGRLFATSLPRFIDEPVRLITQRFDALDRVVEQRTPDSALVRRTYQGHRTVVIDPLNRESSSTTDFQGRLIETRDAKNGITKFNYDVAGRLIGVIDAIGQHVRMQYDDAGNQILLEDPAAGKWEYAYDAFGELVNQRDPRGSVATIELDLLGRPVRKTTASEATTWFYDSTDKGIGRLNSVRTSRGYQKEFRYDEFGREATAIVSYGAEHVTATQTYDRLGRPVRRGFSTGLSFTRSYDAAGYESEITAHIQDRHEVLWARPVRDAAGRVTSDVTGNGVSSQIKFDQNTLRPISMHASKGSRQLFDLALEYDVIGNLAKRADRVARVEERFKYDELNRLLSAEAGGQAAVSVTYDALGNITTKSDEGTYRYCGGNTGKARLCAVQAADGVVTDINHDAAGNITDLGRTAVTYDSEGRAVEIRAGPSRRSAFVYGPDGDVVEERGVDGLNRYVSTSFDDVDVLYEEHAPPIFPTPERTRIRHYLTSPRGSLGFYEFTHWHFPTRRVEPFYSALLSPFRERTTQTSAAMTYFVQDQLGSVRVVLDDEGNVQARNDFDPWGKRKAEPAAYRTVKQGFTGHAQLDHLGLVHMRGRIYSPSLGRFISADPIVQTPEFSQSFNRYAYVANNPLRFVDPSGFFLGDLWDAITGAVGWLVDTFIGKPLRWLGEQLYKAGQWISQNWRTIVSIAASVALTAIGVPPILTGAILGGLSSALCGGSISDILKGAAIGAVTAYLFGEIGDAKLDAFTSSAAHGTVGGAQTAAQGGDFGQGFAAGFFTHAVAPGIDATPNMGARVAEAAIVGGVVSEISGGSFENGAITGAFSRLFNDEAHFEEQGEEVDLSDVLEFEGGVMAIADVGPVSLAWDAKTGAYLGAEVSGGVGPVSVGVGLSAEGRYSVGAGVGAGKVQGGVSTELGNKHLFNATAAGRVGPAGAYGTVREGPGVYRIYKQLENYMIRSACPTGCGIGWR